MTPEEFVSGVLLTIAFLNTQETGYAPLFLKDYKDSIWDALRIYSPETGKFQEYMQSKSEKAPITIFLQISNFLLMNNRLESSNMMLMTKCINRSVVYLGCTPSLLARQFIRSGFAFEITQDYISTLTLINRVISYGYHCMYNHPLLLLEAIRKLSNDKNIPKDKKEQWVQEVYVNILPILHTSMIKGTVPVLRKKKTH
jgi:hypothetical protein